MGLTPNQQLVFRLIMYLVFVLCGLGFIDAVYFGWQRRRRLLTPLQERRRTQRLVALSSFTSCLLFVWIAGKEYFEGGFSWIVLSPIVIVPVLIANLHRVFRSPKAKDFERNFALNSRHCGRCEYDLTGNVSGMCPECGWVIPATPMRVEEPNWWCWWKKWGIEYLERWRTTFILHVFIVLSSFGLAAVSLFVYTLLEPIVIIDPLDGMGRLHRPWFVYIVPVCALVMVVVGLHITINLIRIALYRLRKNGGQ